jgi:hypothetical protein
LAAHGAKHCGSEFGADTTFGGAAVATPADSKAMTAAAIRVRYGIKSSSYDSELRPPGATGFFLSTVSLTPEPIASSIPSVPE